MTDVPTRRSRLVHSLGRVGAFERIGLSGVLALTLLSVFAGAITPYDPYLRSGPPYLAPDLLHWFGTDEIGRDLFSRVVLAVRYTWLPSLGVVLVSGLAGTALGAASGALGGWVDEAIQQITSVFLLIPSTIVALAVTAALGPGLWNATLAMTVTWWPWYVRLSRDEVARLKVQPHFLAARASGVVPHRLLLRYLLPGAIPTLVVAASLDITNAIMTLSLMSFLGLGQPAPIPELGSMTARSLESLTAFWWLPTMPAATLLILCVVSNLAGDGARAMLRST
ncbi:ABC transporter permease [Rhizobium sp. Leaf383]|uniref:ABC transporter permease n=1 Tax=Rhizobium sp. Leaf383 TaxID=1736357 RepID=UPI0007159F4E|nr:ABC transporter permease [Rhizobium sp. Leaf383]KQS76415.1 ABC transporter permease [Rhizobium sp. Leaf383]